MRSDTKTISINVRPGKVVAFLSDPRNLPRWAVGFAKSVREENGRFWVATGGGDIGIRVETELRSGVVDFLMSPGSSEESLAASRVVPNGSGCEYVFTQFQAPGMPDEMFDKNV